METQSVKRKPGRPRKSQADRKQPELTPEETPREALSFYCNKQGRWVVEHLLIQGDKVIKREASEPDLKVIARHYFQIACGKLMTKDA